MAGVVNVAGKNLDTVEKQFAEIVENLFPFCAFGGTDCTSL